MSNKRRSINSVEHEIASATRRKAELLAADPTVHRYGDVKPEDGRDVYHVLMHREDCGGGYVAYLWPWDFEQRFRIAYGRRDPDGLWSYEPPAGAKAVVRG